MASAANSAPARPGRRRPCLGPAGSRRGPGGVGRRRRQIYYRLCYARAAGQEASAADAAADARALARARSSRGQRARPGPGRRQSRRRQPESQCPLESLAQERRPPTQPARRRRQIYVTLEPQAQVGGVIRRRSRSNTPETRKLGQ